MQNKSSALLKSADLFSALGDPTRLSLVSRLSDAGPMSITELSDGEDMSRQAITKHLKIMEEVGLVTVTRQGREQIWELEQKRLDIAKAYIERISSRWDDTLNRLKRFVED